MNNFSKISFYVVAHADDWQLFMQPNAFNDLVAADTKVIFIITTAGDAGAGENYWSSREEGLKSSVRFCLQPVCKIRENNETREVNQHPVNYWSANNTACYFLRLPDGNLNGMGFSGYQYHSLYRLRKEQTSTIPTVDSSATYNSWADFCYTIQTIIETESKDIEYISVNYLNPDTCVNPNDHADHITTGLAIQEIPIISQMQQTLFVGYSVGKSQSILDPANLFWKTGMFAVYEKAVYDNSGYSTLQEGISTYLNWCLSGPLFITINPLHFS